MNISASECSSGCESGWTMYLDQYSDSENQYNRNIGTNIDHGIYGTKGKTTEYMYEEQEDYEDMSMVSDASSGPPQHFHEDEEYCFDENGYIFYPSATENTKAKEKRQIKEHKGHKQNVYLDDTASSPFSSFPKENRCYNNDTTSLEMVAGFSKTHSKGKSVLGKHFGFLKTSVSGKTSSEKSTGGLKGRKRQ